MPRFSQSLGVSVGIHIAALALVILVVYYHPSIPLPAPDASLANAIAVTVTPPPQPPQPVHPLPTPPVPQPPPQIISTQTSLADLSTPPPKTQPAPSPPQPTQNQTSAQEATYAQIVSAMLEANKRYPHQALIAGDQGTVVLTFVLNNQGTVLAYRIERSSGMPIFDQAVKRLIQRVHFPPFPRGNHAERKKFTVPIVFTLKT